jgi:thymidylate kinase
VDLLMPGSMLPGKLAGLLHEHRDELGADVVLWLQDVAQYIVLAGRGEDGRPAILQLHVSADYVMDGHRFYSGQEILQSRRRHENFWVPAPGVEFGCVLANRITKRQLRDDHARRLSELVEEDPSGCEANLSRLFAAESMARIMDAARREEWEWVRANVGHLRDELLRGKGARRATGGVTTLVRRLKRWLKPTCGLHVVFLGPDGVGKSSVIEAVRRELSPIFLHTKYLTFAPGLLPSRFETPKPDGPHSLPARSYIASLVKAAWWSVCYTLGYYTSIRPTVARAGWVVNHRYLPDAIVDRRRYRYSGPVWPLRALWKIAPKPDLLFLLDAPAEVIQTRKKEVAAEETRRQREAYRAVVQGLPFARVIDASQPLDAVVAQVEQAILAFLGGRVSREFMKGGMR